MRAALLPGLTVLFAALLVMSACGTGISEEEYSKLESDFTESQQDLEQARTTISQLQTTLAGTQEELNRVESELEYFRSNPPVLEVAFVDVGEIARLTSLKASRGVTGNSTYIIECMLERTGDLPGAVNVIDVELYIDDLFIDSARWIDISSLGYITTRQIVYLNTGLSELNRPLQIRIVPSFKVFGT